MACFISWYLCSGKRIKIMENLKLNSKFCLTPTQCYDVKTDIPVWLLVILIGSSVLLVKEIYKNLT